MPKNQSKNAELKYKIHNKLISIFADNILKQNIESEQV